MNSNYVKLCRFVSIQIAKHNYVSILLFLYSVYKDELLIGLIFDANELQRLYISGLIERNNNEYTNLNNRIMEFLEINRYAEESLNLPNGNDLVPYWEITEEDRADCKRYGTGLQKFTRSRKYFFELLRKCK